MKIGYRPETGSTYGLIGHVQEEIMNGIASTGSEAIPCPEIKDTRGREGFFTINYLAPKAQQAVSTNVPLLFHYLIDVPFYHRHGIDNLPPSVRRRLLENNPLEGRWNCGFSSNWSGICGMSVSLADSNRTFLASC